MIDLSLTVRGSKEFCEWRSSACACMGFNDRCRRGGGGGAGLNWKGWFGRVIMTCSKLEGLRNCWLCAHWLCNTINFLRSGFVCTLHNSLYNFRSVTCIDHQIIEI